MFLVHACSQSIRKNDHVVLLVKTLGNKINAFTIHTTQKSIKVIQQSLHELYNNNQSFKLILLSDLRRMPLQVGLSAKTS